MKKFVIVVFALLFVSVSIFAGSWTSYEDYLVYKDAKAAASEASDNGDTVTAVAKYKEAAALAAKSATKEIQGWQLNNGGYALINKFKTITGYSEKIEKLSAMEPSKEKIAYQTEIAGLFDLQAGLLEEAKTILEEGKALFPAEESSTDSEQKENEGEAEATEEKPAASGPAEKIQSNLDYIDWVMNFTKDNAK